MLAIALRAAASLAYWPALELYADSYDFLRLARVLEPGVWHPSGYSLLLALLALAGRLGAVTVLQHLLGLGIGVLIYLFALRLGVRRWLAALAALPLLLDSYEVSLEQFILAETLTSALLIGGLAVLLWRERVGIRRGALGGLLLGAAVVTRPDTLPVLLIAALYLLVRAGRWRGLISCCAVAAALLIGYGGWYAATYGRFGYSDYTGLWLYGRVAPLATCHRYRLPGRLAELCPPKPVGSRSHNPEYFADGATSPIHALPLGDLHERNVLGERFAIAVVEHQPLAYASAVLADTWHYFTPGRWMTADRIDMQRWKFPPVHISRALKRRLYHVYYANEGFRGPITASPDRALIGPLRAYQSVGYTPGPLLFACLAGALLAALGLARGGARRRHARRAALVLAASGVLIVLVDSMIAQFSYRYGLPLLVLLPPAGAAAADIGLDALARSRLRRPRLRAERVRVEVA